MEEKELFIIGAGSSMELEMEFSFPSWLGLKQVLVDHLQDEGSQLQINSDLFGPPDFDSINAYCKEAIKWLNSVKEIEGDDRKYSSIDQAISNEAPISSTGFKVEKIIWWCIAKRLLLCEYKSIPIFEKSWFYNYLSKSIKLEEELDPGKKIEIIGEFFKNKIFVIFNYDRLIQYIFIRFVLDKLNLNDSMLHRKKADLQKLFNSVAGNFYHPHSNLGMLVLIHHEAFDFYFPASNITFKQSSNFNCIFGDAGPAKSSALSLSSCYDCEKDKDVINIINVLFQNSINSITKVNILGVGSMGLAYNLEKIGLDKLTLVKKLKYTCYDPRESEVYKNFFDKIFSELESNQKIEFKECKDLL